MNPSFSTHQPNLYNLIPPQLPQHPQAPVHNSVTQAQTASTGTLSKAQRRLLGESESARAKRLAKNAERMRQKRATETYDEYKIRLAKNAEANRRRRQNESEAERALRHMRNAMRQRLRRAMETPEQKAIRKARLAQRMREIRANETPDQRRIRLEKGAARARHKFLTESSEERSERNRKKAEYARAFRSNKQKNQIGQEHDSKDVPGIMSIKEEQPLVSGLNPVMPHQHIPLHPEVPVPGSRDVVGHSPTAKNYPINYTDFGAAFPSFFNYPHMKNGQQNAYNTVYPSQAYYPELSAPASYMKANDRQPFPTSDKSNECLQPLPENLPKGSLQKN